jgi:hypothetical protein
VGALEESSTHVPCHEVVETRLVIRRSSDSGDGRSVGVGETEQEQQ